MTRKRLNVVMLILAIILIPVAYLAILNIVIPKDGTRFLIGWEDNTFQTEWTLAYLGPVNASMSSESGVLKVFGDGDLKEGNLVTAQRTSDLEFDLNKYKYINVSIMTSGFDTAARIVIWTESNPDYAYTVLLKTYNDTNWHTEIIDLSYFGIDGSSLFMIELGWMQLYDGSSSTAFYRQLSFSSLEVT
ncbi:MAG TPA: hypothetical protein VIH48_00875 [Candidatus Bathyarchaeia archaeon]